MLRALSTRRACTLSVAPTSTAAATTSAAVPLASAPAAPASTVVVPTLRLPSWVRSYASEVSETEDETYRRNLSEPRKESPVRMYRNITKHGMGKGWKLFFYTGDVPGGNLIGTDKFGNKYYEDPDAYVGKHRIVEFARKDFDASQIPAEWHGWLCHFKDEPPTLGVKRHFWQLDHEPNMSGTEDAYAPWSTTEHPEPAFPEDYKAPQHCKDWKYPEHWS